MRSTPKREFLWHNVKNDLSVKIKLFVRTTMPACVPILERLRDPGKTNWRRSVFCSIYERKVWAAGEAWPSSGPGSSLAYTHSIRTALPRIVRDFRIRTLLDAACGDFTWMAHLRLDLDE
jgi:hypothetical protein